MKYNMNDYKRELKLTLENTQELYKMAVAMTDFDWQGRQVLNLYLSTWATINQNAGENVAPELITDHDVKQVHMVISETARDRLYPSFVVYEDGSFIMVNKDGTTKYGCMSGGLCQKGKL